MTAYYLKSGSGAAEFVASATYASGDRMVPRRADAGANYLVARKWVWECTTGGAAAGADPTWPASVTQDVTTVTSGGATFTARRPGYSSGTTANWSFATIYLDYAITAPTTTGDVLYVSNNHAETVAGTISPVAPVASMACVCVDDSSAPPTATATTASVTTTGNNNINIDAYSKAYYYGITFTSGSGASGAANIVPVGCLFERCNFVIATTHATSQIYNSGGSYEMINCGVKFAAAGQGFLVSAGSQVNICGGSLLSGGTSPTVLFSGSNGGLLLMEDFDLSNASSSIVLVLGNGVGRFTFRNMKIPASWSGSLSSTTPTHLTSVFSLFNGDSSGTNYVLSQFTFRGTTAHELTLVKTGGASNGTTPLSWKIVSTSSCGPVGCYSSRHFTPEIVRWNETTGSPITVTVDFLRDSATGLKNDEIWLEVSYLSESGSPLGAMVSSAKSDYLATASTYTASTATWTTTGMSNPNTQKMSVTFTPQLKGFIHATVKLAKASTTVYVDPVLQISGGETSAQRMIPGATFINEGPGSYVGVINGSIGGAVPSAPVLVGVVG